MANILQMIWILSEVTIAIKLVVIHAMILHEK